LVTSYEHGKARLEPRFQRILFGRYVHFVSNILGQCKLIYKKGEIENRKK
jgi:hypothetical protein